MCDTPAHTRSLTNKMSNIHARQCVELITRRTRQRKGHEVRIQPLEFLSSAESEGAEKLARVPAGQTSGRWRIGGVLSNMYVWLTDMCEYSFEYR